MKTIGFAAPTSESAHHFRLDHTTEGVDLAEVAGYLERGTPRAWPRAHLPRNIWAMVAGDVRDELNKRIASAGPGTAPGDWAAHPAEAGRGTTASTRLDRLLGKELTVLLWALEGICWAQNYQARVGTTVDRWRALRPEERWWLFAMAVGEGGGPRDGIAPWRRAIRAALACEVPQ